MFDLEKSIEEIQNLVSDLRNDKDFINANIAKLSTAISVGKIIVKIHKNIDWPITRTKTNDRIKAILGRERSTIQDYKRLTYFEVLFLWLSWVFQRQQKFAVIYAITIKLPAINF